MRFQLNFAAVVRNVAVMANVAILAVVRFVAAYLPVHYQTCWLGTHETETMCRVFSRLDSPGSPSGMCDPSLSSFLARLSGTNFAYAVVSPQSEINGRQMERLLSKRRREYASSFYRG